MQSEDAINVLGSPARRLPYSTGISISVTFLAVSIISFTEKPLPLPKLKALDSPPLIK